MIFVTDFVLFVSICYDAFLLLVLTAAINGWANDYV